MTAVPIGIYSQAFPFAHGRHWLTGTYTQFAVPYFIYDIYAMFMCHWHKYRVKGHEVASVSAGTQTLRNVTWTYLHKEFLMVVHHLFMVLVCFPISVVSGAEGTISVQGGGWRSSRRNDRGCPLGITGCVLKSFSPE